jgi:hypothetical protein
MAGFPKRRRIPLVEGGVNARPRMRACKAAEGHLAASLLLNFRFREMTLLELLVFLHHLGCVEIYL